MSATQTMHTVDRSVQAPSAAGVADVPVNFQKQDSTAPAIAEAVSYALTVARGYLHLWQHYVRGGQPGTGQPLAGLRLLEIGPGPTLGVPVLLACAGARVTVADRFPAAWDADFHPRFFGELLRQVGEGPWSAGPIERLLSAGDFVKDVVDSHALPAEELDRLDGTFDLIFSNAVLEHVQDLSATTAALARISAPGAHGFHQVDLRDHRNFSRPLEHLTIGEDEFEEIRRRSFCECGGLWRASDVAAAFGREGFTVTTSPNLWADPEYLKDVRPRLRSEFAGRADEDLAVTSALFVVSRGSSAPPGPLTYLLNRTPSATRTRVPGTLRIAFVGDSMTYGAGLQYKQALGTRVAAHLGGALPEYWTESLTFGSPGGCAYHAVGRVLTQAVPAAPHIIVLCLCCNDAIMLASQPDTAEALARTWIDFQPLLRTTLATFRETAARARAHALVVYHDRIDEIAGVPLPAELGKICTELDLPFIDGSALIAKRPVKDIVVSPADGHLGASATDLIARQVAQFLVGRQWTPVSTGFGDPAWIDAAERVAEARVAGGVPAAIAYGEAAAVLEAKWLHRRNTNRRQFEARYTAARTRLLDAQRTGLSALAASACGHLLRSAHPVGRINAAEVAVNEAMTASFALQHLATTRGGDRTLALIPHVADRSGVDRVDVQASLARWQGIRDTSARLCAALRDVCSSAAATHAPDDGEYLLFWASRVWQWSHAVQCCGDRYVDLIEALPGSLVDAATGLLSYADARATAVWNALVDLEPVLQRIVAWHQRAGQLAGAGAMTLELIMSGPPGPEQWAVNVGVQSRSPAFTESHLACFNVIRDAQPHSYRIDIPLMLTGDVQVQLFGEQVSAAEEHLKIAGRLSWGDQEASIVLPRARLEAASAGTVALVYHHVGALTASAS